MSLVRKTYARHKKGEHMQSVFRSVFDHKTIKRYFGPASRNLPLLLLCAVFVVMGCGGIRKLVSSDGSGGNQSPDSAKPASPLERQLQLHQPRVLTYADLQFTATKAVISNRTDDMLPIDNTKPEIADITFSVVNTLKQGVQIQNGLWQLRLGDGSVYKQIYSDGFEPRDTKERKISFRVPANSQWTGAQIVLDEQDKEPATLVLDGDVPPPQYPVNIATSGIDTVAKKPSSLTYNIVKATMDVDAFGTRSALDKRYLTLTVRVTDKGPGGGGGYFLPEYFRLLTDGDPSQPENSSDSGLNSGGTQDYTMSYVVPKNVSMVDLEVGKPDEGPTEKIHLDLEKATQ
jgi:hypothetical protein